MPILNWIGKEAVVKHHQKVPHRLLESVKELPCSPCPRASEELREREATTENPIVQEDNLNTSKGPTKKSNEGLLA